MIIIKSEFDIIQIKKACEVWKIVRKGIYKYAKEGATLIELDEIAYKIIKDNECLPTFKGYMGYKHSICTSVNEVVIHGVPDKYKLKNGDTISIDVGVTYNNYVCDAAYTIVIGNNLEAEKISKVCYDSLIAGISKAKPGNRIGDISNAIEKVISSNGYKILQNFTGHGCGRQMHEEPVIPNIGKPGTGPKIIPGMVLCIEPMILTDKNNYYISKDGWSVISSNKKLACHWEHMILITQDGCEILTI